MTRIITFSGKARSGKDTSAKIFKRLAEKNNNRVLIIHFADYLKFCCKKYFKWNGKKDEAGRKILQYVGTDKARAKDPDFWVRVVLNFVKVFGDDYDYVLIPDCRFESEMGCFYSDGMEISTARIERPNFDNGLPEEQKKHSSETSLDNYEFFDFVVNNDMDKSELKKKISKIYTQLQEV